MNKSIVRLVKRFFYLTILLSAMVGCNSFKRSSDSGYGSAVTKSTKSGWKKVDPAEKNETTGRYSVADDQQLRIKQLENSLSSRKEIEQYSRALPWLKNDTEKIEFLSLPGFEARQKWLSENNMPDRIQRVKSQLKELVESQDIALGMPEELVRKSWGEPDSVDVSGNPLFRNQRWRYSKYISTQDGYKQERKVVYFEGGKVVGWEIE